MGLLDRLKDKASNSSPSSQADVSSNPAPPPIQLGPAAIPRYRNQRGVNLGSWFVLERWICPQAFHNAAPPGQSDHDVASGKDARALLENHWDTWITDEDWGWIKDRGFNSVRLPIGYYHLCGACPDVLKGTDFEPFAAVFEGAWGRIERAIEKAGQYGLGVLIGTHLNSQDGLGLKRVDLHAAAGAQNTDAHSGLSKGRANLWSSSTDVRSTSLALQFLASRLSPIPHVIGLELLNEPQNSNHLQKWYETSLTEIRQITGPEFPIYIGDAWDTQWYAGWVGKRDDFVVLDHHLYRCFADGDKGLNGEQHAQKLRNEFRSGFAGQSQAAKGNLVVGEWSASLDMGGLQGMSGGEQDRQRREFVRAQLELFEHHTAGWWFWTYKKGEGWDAGWSARDASQAEILPSWVGSMNFRGSPSPDMKNQALHQAHGEHKGYWQSHGGSPNPEVFAPGFSQGWDDTLMFLSAPGGSELGFVSQWARRRKEEYEAGNQNLGKAAWEWETGFAKGVEMCKASCMS